MSNLLDEFEYVVIDTETTGLYKNDKIIEIALITCRGKQILEEWSTLLNPNRDIGKTDLHGITPSMVSAAPSFEDVVNDIFRLLDGKILVGHNLIFDSRMLTQEIDQIAPRGSLGKGFCTMIAARRLLPPGQFSLQNACAAFNIPVIDGHSALGDARMTRTLFEYLSHDEQSVSPTNLPYSPNSLPGRTLGRSAFISRTDDSLNRMRAFTEKVPFPTSEEKFISYLTLLNMALEDMRISEQERFELGEWANKLEITAAEIRKLHEGYLDSFIHSALRDGVITIAEREMIESVATALGLPAEIPETPQQIEANSENLLSGKKVCFTGQAIGINGAPTDRQELEAIAAKAGLYPVSGVSKKGCDVLVAADVNSMSGKAKKAKELGIPVMSVKAFLSCCAFS